MEKVGEGLAIWGASKFIRTAIVKHKANKVIDNLDMLQFGTGTGNEYRNVVITTKLLNFVVPALIGIGTAVGAVISEFNGNHDTALLLYQQPSHTWQNCVSINELLRKVKNLSIPEVLYSYLKDVIFKI